MGLNEEYGAVKKKILSTNSLPRLGITYHLVSQYEQQRQIGMSRASNNNSTAFQAYGKFNLKVKGNRNFQSINNKKKNNDPRCIHYQNLGI